MSIGLYSHTTRATGTVLTAAIYNADHQTHITNQNPVMTGGYSDSVSQMQSNVNPGGIGSEILATSLAGELERIRFQIKAITGELQWYAPPDANLATLAGSGVADNSITNAKLADMAAWTIKTRNAGSSGDPTDESGATLTQRTPAGTTRLAGWLTSGELGYFLINDIGSIIVVATPPVESQGRLTLTASTPVMIASAAAQTTIRYSPYKGRFVPLWNGSAYINTDILGELTQTTTDNTKSPAATANNSNYDLLVWDDAGTKRCTRGPAWSSDTSRGTGAGTAELVRVNGILLNAQNITNGPAAQRGTYVGTIRTNGTASVDWVYGTIASGGGLATLGVWNNYNRVDVETFVGDSTDSWTLDTVTWRSANNSANMRVNFIQGLQEDTFYSDYTTRILPGCNISGTVQTDAKPAISVALDSTTTPTGRLSGGGKSVSGAVGPTQQHTASYMATHLGFHFLQAIEQSALNTVSFHTTMYGDNSAGTPMQNGIRLRGRF